MNQNRTSSEPVPTGPPSIDNDAYGIEKLLLKTQGSEKNIVVQEQDGQTINRREKLSGLDDHYINSSITFKIYFIFDTNY